MVLYLCVVLYGVVFMCGPVRCCIYEWHCMVLYL